VHVNNEDFESQGANLIETWRELYGENQFRQVGLDNVSRSLLRSCA
jgi:hypothetical protein